MPCGKRMPPQPHPASGSHRLSAGRTTRGKPRSGHWPPAPGPSAGQPRRTSASRSSMNGRQQPDWVTRMSTTGRQWSTGPPCCQTYGEPMMPDHCCTTKTPPVLAGRARTRRQPGLDSVPARAVRRSMEPIGWVPQIEPIWHGAPHNRLRPDARSCMICGRQRGACLICSGRSGLLGGVPGVDRECHAGDVAGLVGDQPGDRVADVGGFDELDVQEVAHIGTAGGGSAGE